MSFAFVGLAPSLGGAQPALTERLQLTWTAPTECPRADRIRRDVQSLLSRTSLVASSEPISVDAAITRTADGRYSLDLSANGQTRSLAGASCTKVAEAAALLIALLLQPTLSEADASPALEAAPAVADTSAGAAATLHERPAPTRLSHAEPTKIGDARLAALVEIAGRLEMGSWPKLEPAVLAGLGLESARWRLLLRVGLGGRISLNTEQSSAIELVPITLGVEPAIRLVYGHWGLEPGVGAELGVTHSSSAELEPKKHDALSFLFLALLRGSRDLGAGVRVWSGVGAGLPLLRPRWVSRGGEVYHAFGPAIRGELGLQMRF